MVNYAYIKKVARDRAAFFPASPEMTAKAKARFRELGVNSEGYRLLMNALETCPDRCLRSGQI